LLLLGSLSFSHPSNEVVGFDVALGGVGAGGRGDKIDESCGGSVGSDCGLFVGCLLFVVGLFVAGLLSVVGFGVFLSVGCGVGVLCGGQVGCGVGDVVRSKLPPPPQKGRQRLSTLQ
jgi:hypothetical protein